MNLLRTPASSLALSALVAATLAGTTADAGDYVDGAPIAVGTSRCTALGPGFVDMGNGTCARTSSHVRVEFGTLHASRDAWTGGATANAALHSEGPEFMPGVGASHQLRVRSGLQTLSPFQ